MKKGHKRTLTLVALVAATAVVVYLYRKRQAAQQAQQQNPNDPSLGGFGDYLQPMLSGGVSSYPEYLPAPQQTATTPPPAVNLDPLHQDMQALLASLNNRPKPATGGQGGHGSHGKTLVNSHLGNGGWQANPPSDKINPVTRSISPPRIDNPGHYIRRHDLVGLVRSAVSSAPANPRQHQDVAPPQHQRAPGVAHNTSKAIPATRVDTPKRVDKPPPRRSSAAKRR